MHHLDQEEFGKVLRKGYGRKRKRSKKQKIIRIILCVLYSIMVFTFLALSISCGYWVYNGIYLYIAIPVLFISAVLFAISLLELYLTLKNYDPICTRTRSKVKSEPDFLPDPPTPPDISSYQSLAISSESLHNFIPEQSTSRLKSTSSLDEEILKYLSEETIKHRKAKKMKMIRSVSQYEVENAPNQDQLTEETVAESSSQSSLSSSSSRKRVCQNSESEEGLIEIETLPFVESSVPAGTKEVKVSYRCSSQSLPAIKIMSNSDT